MLVNSFCIPLGPLDSVCMISPRFEGRKAKSFSTRNCDATQKLSNNLSGINRAYLAVAPFADFPQGSTGIPLKFIPYLFPLLFRPMLKHSLDDTGGIVLENKSWYMPLDEICQLCHVFGPWRFCIVSKF
jgi:hypothetical protein